jgi:hypothetical protein
MLDYIKKNAPINTLLLPGVQKKVAERLGKPDTRVSTMFGSNPKYWNEDFYEIALELNKEQYLVFLEYEKKYREALKNRNLAAQLTGIQNGTHKAVPIDLFYEEQVI